ncbi:uncharacterized protein LOC109597571 [Aethina tumida]|uniref:uncharacterized protein LOC109597571 n=1 Tax=Aethina tumida TaxID=116153 RepID=UPI002148BCBE|nr:uncharacterized protein LOC109597571 [Aethina tumida]
MSVLDDRNAYLKSPYFTKSEYGDFTPFYITVTICTVIGLSIFILNIVFGCCSRYSGYWSDRYTGNRWIVSLWTTTPHLQPALDYTELQEITVPSQQTVYHSPSTAQPKLEYLELQKRESDI